MDVSAFLRLPNNVKKHNRNVSKANIRNISQKSGTSANPLKKNTYAKGGNAISNIAKK